MADVNPGPNRGRGRGRGREGGAPAIRGGWPVGRGRGDGGPRGRAGDQGRGRGDGGRGAGGRGAGTARQSEAPRHPPVPRDVCRAFWESGTCVRGSGCRFKHETAPGVQPVAPRAIEGAGRRIAEGGANEASTTRSPHEVLRHLRRFLGDDYRFNSVAQMQAFSELLLNSTDDSWMDEDSLNLLNFIASGNGLLRIASVLTHENVSTRSVSNNVLSFKRGYFPVFKLLSSTMVVRSTLNHLVNALFAALDNNIGTVLDNLQKCMREFMSGSFGSDATSKDYISGLDVYATLTDVLYEYMTRLKDVVARHADLEPFVNQFNDWFETWAAAVRAPDRAGERFRDTVVEEMDVQRRDFAIKRVRERMGRIINIVQRETRVVEWTSTRRTEAQAHAHQSDTQMLRLRMLEASYVGPGGLREGGPRHNNDFVDISRIQVAPTDQELLCLHAPFLPANIPNAPHPHPVDSMARLMDIQFRLLREELLSPLRSSVQIVRQDLLSTRPQQTLLAPLKKNKGGRYKHQDKQDSVMFNVYTGVEFGKVEIDTRKGIVAELVLDTPPGSARHEIAATRASYWLGSGKKRLMNGGLVALLWHVEGQVDVHLAAVAIANDKLAQGSRAHQGRLPIKVQFFDSMVNIKIVEHLRQKNRPRDERILVESSVMFDSIRPFLDALKRVPETVPFSRYLPHPSSGSLSGMAISPPAYSTRPGFRFKLDCLLEPSASEEDRRLHIDTSDALSIAAARTQLAANSRLDPSQVNSVVDALSREVSLIQGPPGTGKVTPSQLEPQTFTNAHPQTFMGVELIRVLLKNNVGPILLIAYTNHSLDNMLMHIIKAGITRDVVRLGSRSSDPAIVPFTMEEIQRAAGRSNFDRSGRADYAKLKETEEKITKLLGRVIGSFVPSDLLVSHLQIAYPDHLQCLNDPPQWVSTFYEVLYSGASDSNDEPWHEVGRRGKITEDLDNSLYGLWRHGTDLAFLRRLAQFETTDLSEEEYDLFDKIGDISTAHEPRTDRALEELLQTDSFDVWNFSAPERLRLHDFWEQDYRDASYENYRDEIDSLLRQHEQLRVALQDRNEAVRLGIMRGKKLVGCTTTGAAKLISLLKNFAPKVMLVEEAGQVLEAHVLGCLVDTIQHLILIGDPLQLRPGINTYALSADNTHGGEIYKFDMSLMERLYTTEFPMSLLATQRRMRPAISSLIRDTLYPALEDNEIVMRYPSVRGIANNVFFLSHSNPESGGGEDSVSKHNTYEVAMIKDLVKYFLRQGCYTAEGSIVVLCAYLGQLLKVRDSLKNEMAVVIDERDQDTLDAHGDGDEAESRTNVERVGVTQRVRIRSIDNYQGEEADIVILSLVRNSGDGTVKSSRPSIGFLKSPNRTNVAISRARHGLFILGNADDFRAQSQMWSSIISKLEGDKAIGPRLPIKCHQHPHEIRYISKPGDLPRESPDGGCLRNCETRLDCGHACPYKCHADMDSHRNLFCLQKCTRLCSRGHPCNNQCGQRPCGKCLHPIFNVLLPCGHTAKSVACYLVANLREVKCSEIVERALSTCEHSAKMMCSNDVLSYQCESSCNGTLACCGNPCTAKCFTCQDARPRDSQPSARSSRTRHQSHKCGRPLFCEHECPGTCSADHSCLDACQERCRQRCVHGSCNKRCSDPCTPCKLPCDWKCSHLSCNVPCGSICNRLPCDEPCQVVLSCGHPCPSVCGEDCSLQLCLKCSPDDALDSIADLVMQRTLRDLDPSSGSLDERIITLPDCKHTFTVETVDGICELSDYYSKKSDGKWYGLLTPKVEYKKPPSCPICRRAIRSPRYSRVYKRADLDILERNVSISSSRSLQTIRESLSDFDSNLARDVLFKDLTSISMSSNEAGGARANTSDALLASKPDEPVSWSSLAPRNSLHSIPEPTSKRWNDSISTLRAAYSHAMKVALMRSAHATVWEASFSTLYHQEMYYFSINLGFVPRRPEEHAMRLASMKVGQPKPLADQRFRVEAIWITIDVRHRMAELAEAWLKNWSKKLNASPASLLQTSWARYISFMHKSCVRDAELALKIADGNGSHKQALRSSSLLLYARLLMFKFKFELVCGKGMTIEERDDLMKEAAKELEQHKDIVDNEAPKRQRHVGMDKQEYKRIFFDLASKTLDQWKKIEYSLIHNTIYSPLTEEDLREVVTVMMQSESGLQYGGHWYECPNGHPFVIGDCGGANGTAVCPECGERIGGQDHHLLDTNRRNRRLESVAANLGALRGPFQWNRDDA